MKTERYDLYGPIHKGLRLAHAEMMTRLARADYAAAGSLLDDLNRHLDLCRRHLTDEDRHVHPALEARRPGATAELERQHDEHRDDFERLTRTIAAVERAAPAERAEAGRQLFLTFTTFVAADLAHMHEEETQVFATLCELFSDEELQALEMAIIADLAPAENIAFMRLIIPAVSAAERAALLGGVKASAPPEAFLAIVEHAVRPTLAPEDFAVLERLGLAA